MSLEHRVWRIAIVFILTLVPAAVAAAQGAPDWAHADSVTVRLAPSAFPELPADVRRDLERRGCRVPQTFAGGRPHNVIRGAFTGPTRHDWAVLCSVAGVSRILVYRGRTAARGTAAAAAAVADSLAPEPDRAYLQTGVQPGAPQAVGFSRKIGIAPPSLIRSYAASADATPLRPLDHSGIEDSFLEKASVIFYFHRGRWRTFAGAD